MNNKLKIAVCLFAYNRPKYLAKAIRTHKKLDELDYFAFIDYSDMQQEIYDIIKQSGKYDYVLKRRKHRGLNDNITNGIDTVLNFLDYDAVIVLEDDLLIADGGFFDFEHKLE